MMKRIFKLNTYAHGKKMAFICGIAFLLVGCIEKFGGKSVIFGDISVIFGNYFILFCATTWNIQLLYSLAASGMVSASPYRKKLQTGYPVILQILSVLPFLLFICLADWIRISQNPDLESRLAPALFWSIVVYSIVLLYLGICFKYFFASTVLLIVIEIFGVTIIMFIAAPIINALTYLQALLIGIGILIVASLLQYALSILVHKTPPSKYALTNSLRKQM